LSCGLGEAVALPFADHSFDLVIAIGVLSWLERAERAVQEMSRVTRPGGHVIFGVHNRTGAATLLDPARNPVPLPRV